MQRSNRVCVHRAISERTFGYLRQVDSVYEVTEEQLRYWTQWVTHLLKVTVEPTGACVQRAAQSAQSSVGVCLFARLIARLPLTTFSNRRLLGRCCGRGVVEDAAAAAQCTCRRQVLLTC